MSTRFAIPVRPASERAAQARSLVEAGASVTVRDFAVRNGAKREVPTAPLMSRSTCPWWERPDVYWNNRLFGAQRGWVSGSDVGAMDDNAKMVLGGLILQGQPDDVYRRRYTPNHAALIASAEALCTDPYLSVVSILRGTGRCLGGQLAALSGVESTRSEAGFLKVAKPLIHAEVLESSWHHAPGIAHPRVKAWQINNGSSYAAWARRVLELGVGPRVFGCMRPSLSARSDIHRVRATRHQVLSVEVALRAMELSDTWVGWMPETACRPEWFLPPEHPAQDIGLRIVADGCLIRRDGARIFIEVEASAGNEDKFDNKIAAWSSMFGGGGFGGAVLFVVAGQPNNMNAIARKVRKSIEQNATAQARPYFMVGSWHDYSPDFGLLTYEAASLRGGRHTGRKWEECHAENLEVVGAERGIVDRLRDLAFTPSWTAHALDLGSESQ